MSIVRYEFAFLTNLIIEGGVNMLLIICEVIMDFVIVGVPMFFLGMFVNEIMNEKKLRETLEKDSKERNERIKRIDYLTDIVIKKRQKENKIDVD